MSSNTGDRVRPSVLLVDDVEANLVALEGLLEPLDCDLVRARSGNEGLRQLLKREFAVMLLDVHMPGMDGYEMAEYARNHSATRETPIIFITASTLTEETLLQGYGSGAVDVLFKPVSPTILRSKVRVFLDLYNTRRRLSDEVAGHKRTLHDLRRAGDELAARHEALALARREQQELTAFIVHDLKSPLSVVHAGLEVARELTGSAPLELREILDEASMATHRLKGMVEDLLVISRMEEPTFPLQREPVSVTGLLGTVLNANVRRAQERGIDLSLLPPPAADLQVVGDRTLLERVFENLLDNAFRYTPTRGRIAFSARRAPRSVEVDVSNDGPAIPADERARIFEKFHRGGGDVTTLGNAGLGLYFCKRAVEAHGGGIDVVERPEWPTSFRISLPVEAPV